MPLIRGHHAFDEHFTQIPNAWLRDDRLSLESRGLLAQILSHAPGWQLSLRSVALQNHVGRDKVKRMVDELLGFGYLQRSEKQEHDENGHLAGFSYVTCDPDGGWTQKPYKAEPYKAEPSKVDRATKNTIPKNTINKKTIKREKPLPDDWQPKESVYTEDRYSVLDIDSEAESFRNWCLANGKQYVDWDAAFRNWLKKGLDFYAKKHYKEDERSRARRELEQWLRKKEGSDDVD